MGGVLVGAAAAAAVGWWPWGERGARRPRCWFGDTRVSRARRPRRLCCGVLAKMQRRRVRRSGLSYSDVGTPRVTYGAMADRVECLHTHVISDTGTLGSLVRVACFAEETGSTSARACP